MTDTTAPRRDKFSLKTARKIALAAQGFGGARESAADFGPMRRMIERLGVLQIDSVNVLIRSHYLPLYSRLGPYPTARLDAAAKGRKRALFEYWGHEASLLPAALYPLLRWRMERAKRGEGIYGGLARFGRDNRPYLDAVLAEIAARGPLSAGELTDGGKGEGGWWGWSEGKRAVEFLFWAGELTTAERRGFERVYGLPEQVLPKDVLATPVPDEADAQRQLLRISARALGIATEFDLRDYFRLDVADTKARLAELVEDGSLVPVTVEGWRNPAYLDPQARIPRRIEAHALLSPFDSLIFERSRTERLFDFHYRLAFYTPADQRTHGYYVMPFLMGDRLVARVDLKSERTTSTLSVPAAHLEDGATPGEVAEALAAELKLLAGWLGLEKVRIGEGGDALAPALKAAVA